MSAAQDFIATVHVIATSDHTETTLNQGITRYSHDMLTQRQNSFRSSRTAPPGFGH
jgi:hypothetical protein